MADEKEKTTEEATATEEATTTEETTVETSETSKTVSTKPVTQVVDKMTKAINPLVKTYQTKSNSLASRIARTRSQLYNLGFQQQERLVTKRQQGNARIQQLNEQFVMATQDVLNDKTLDFLVDHSKINVPTMTSIVAGFELARASRADKLETMVAGQQQQIRDDMKADIDFAAASERYTGKLADVTKDYGVDVRSGLNTGFQQTTKASTADAKEAYNIQGDYRQEGIDARKQASNQEFQAGMQDARFEDAAARMRMEQQYDYYSDKNGAKVFNEDNLGNTGVSATGLGNDVDTDVATNGVRGQGPWANDLGNSNLIATPEGIINDITGGNVDTSGRSPVIPTNTGPVSNADYSANTAIDTSGQTANAPTENKHGQHSRDNETNRLRSLAYDFQSKGEPQREDYRRRRGGGGSTASDAYDRDVAEYNAQKQELIDAGILNPEDGSFMRFKKPERDGFAAQGAPGRMARRDRLREERRQEQQQQQQQQDRNGNWFTPDPDKDSFNEVIPKNPYFDSRSSAEIPNETVAPYESNIAVRDAGYVPTNDAVVDNASAQPQSFATNVPSTDTVTDADASRNVATQGLTPQQLQAMINDPNVMVELDENGNLIPRRKPTTEV